MHTHRTILASCLLALPAIAQAPQLIVDYTPNGSSAMAKAAQAGDRAILLVESQSTKTRTVLSSDGTSLGTHSLGTTWRSANPVASGGDWVFYSQPGTTSIYTDALTRTDGSLENTSVLFSQNNEGVGEMGTVGDRVCFVTGVPFINSAHAYITDGQQVSILVRRLLDAHDGIRGFTPVPASRDFVFLIHQGAVLRSDGTEQGTKYLGPGGTFYMGRTMARARDVIIFRGEAYGRGTGSELWQTDGTPQGTKLLKDIAPGAASSNPEGFVDVGPFALFTATDSAGTELWRTDGTVAGTVRVADFAVDLDPRDIVRTGYGEAILSGVIAGYGRELVRTDGTAAGTRLFVDMHKTASSAPANLARIGAEIFFEGDDGTVGREPYRIAFGAGSWKTEPSCGVPHDHLELDATAPRIGTTMQAFSTQVQPGSPAALVIGARKRKRVPLPGRCYAAIDMAQPFFALDAWTQPSSSKQHTTTVQVPNQSSLIGVRFALQTVQPLSVLAHGFALSNGVECVIGR